MSIVSIPNHPGYYASDDGEIYSARTGILRKLSKRIHNGYYRVNLVDVTNPKRPLVRYVHTLVLNAFVGDKPAGYVCRHLNGNSLDNRVDNLRWGTTKENVADAIKHGTASCLRHGENAVAAKLKLADITEIRKQYSSGQSQKELAVAFSISQRHVSDIVNGKTWCKDIPLGAV